MDHNVYTEWNKIRQAQISNDGQWVVYTVERAQNDPQLNVYNSKTGKTSTFNRATNARITEDNAFLIFNIKAPVDSVKQMRREKVAEKDLPKDSLAILNLKNFKRHVIPNVKSFKIAQKSAQYLVYHLEETKPVQQDSSQNKENKLKKESKENGSKLIIRSLATTKEDTIPFVVDYQLAEESPQVIISSTGDDKDFLAGIYLFDGKAQTLLPIQTGKAKYSNLSIFRLGDQLSFMVDRDTTDAVIRPFELFYWRSKMDSAKMIADPNSSFLKQNWRLSEYKKPSFSKDGKSLYFGVAPSPILQDTSLLKEEIVNVEVWSYQDSRLHTQQKVLLDNQKKKYYLCLLDVKTEKITQLNDPTMPQIRLADEGNASISLATAEEQYYSTLSWEGFPSYKDVYIIDHKSGKGQLIAKKVKAEVNISPKGKYLYWYSYPDSCWFSYNIQKQKSQAISNNDLHPFYDELNDRPMHPFPYGVLSWQDNDRYILIYDRYDIWKIDPDNKTSPVNLTNGRSKMHTYRYIKLDPEERTINPDKPILLHWFDHQSKSSGYANLSIKTAQLNMLVQDEFQFSRRPIKARDAQSLIFTKENFQSFPDLQFSPSLDFKNHKKISNVNPQQADYSWGDIEIYQWTSATGEKLNGLLVKPENFDPSKKYPMLVNFYERSSDGLHRHRAPEPHRSTINYSFYANKGYIIFNPDVPYRVGYPGESAFNAVISGVSSLIDKGFIDKERIGVQGHSWGGYQVAHLITKTNIFKCAESGAPVVNMFSAYGGIRWRSGLSRMFQYEHTQSRIGGTIWEYPLRYLENSPIFFADKIETPVLILHNDKDGAVPWYQGIEFFVALRRLNKPAWLLNYNDEPHWPVKWQNRVDFNIRMQQFFDHYLMDKAKPNWMKKGVPAIEKGINQGLELMGQ